VPVTSADIGVVWRVVAVHVPAAWVGEPVHIVAVDRANGVNGWVGVSEPIRGGPLEDHNALKDMLATWCISGVLLSLVYLAALRWLAPRAWVPAHWLPLLAAAVVATGGYAIFWAYFASPMLGRLASVALVVAGAIGTFWRSRSDSSVQASEIAR